MIFNNSKYTNTYWKIVNRARDRVLEGYTETHHIIPKSLGGSDNSDNLVVLTAREHFICHLLLSKMTDGQNKRKMIHALWYMYNTDLRLDRGMKASPGILYEKTRLRVVEQQTGQKRTSEQRKKFSRLQKERGGYGPKKHSEETKEKIRSALTNRTVSEETRNRQSISATAFNAKRREQGWKLDPEDVKRRADLKRGIPRSPETIAKIKSKCSRRYRAYRDDGSWYWAHRE